jgi:hypothetical protein
MASEALLVDNKIHRDEPISGFPDKEARHRDRKPH